MSPVKPTQRLVMAVTDLGDGGVETRFEGQEAHTERAIRNNETGQLMTEWANVPEEKIRESIAKSHNPERYAVMARYVTEWFEVEA